MNLRYLKSFPTPPRCLPLLLPLHRYHENWKIKRNESSSKENRAQSYLKESEHSVRSESSVTGVTNSSSCRDTQIRQRRWRECFSHPVTADLNKKRPTTRTKDPAWGQPTPPEAKTPHPHPQTPPLTHPTFIRPCRSPPHTLPTGPAPPPPFHSGHLNARIMLSSHMLDTGH